MHSRWMSRSLACGVLLSLVVPVVGQAQTARVEGLALQGDYLKDYTGIYTYPSQIPNVGNLIYGELGRYVAGSSVDRGVGTVMGNLWDGRYGVWGVHLRQFTPALGQGDRFSSPNPGFGGGDPNFNSNEAIDLMWGKKSGTTSFGLRFNRSFFKSKDVLPGVVTSIMEFDADTANTDNTARNVMGIGAGVGFELNPNTNVELTLLYQSRTFENSETRPAGVVSEKDDGPTTYLVGGRAMWQWQPNVLVIPVFRFYSFDLSTSTSVGGVATAADNKLSGWQAGLAGNWTLGTNDLFVLGATVAQNKLSQEDDIFGIAASIPTPVGGTAIGDNLDVTETITPLVFASLETHVNNWLTLRMGAQKGAFHQAHIEETAGGTRDIKVNLSSFLMNIGTGVKLGTVQLDAVLNSTFPQTLGGFFSQTPNYVSFPKVTATYSF